MPQGDLFQVDNRGRMAAKMGLSPDFEVAVDVLEQARHLFRSLGRYQVAVSNCSMKSLSASDRAASLSGPWDETYTAFHGLGEVLKLWTPIEERLQDEIRADVSGETRTAAAAKQSDEVDDAYRKLMSEGMPQDPPPADDDDLRSI